MPHFTEAKQASEELSQPNHTPGPWKFSEAWGASEGDALKLCFHEIRDSKHNTIASTWGAPHEANARLIASAPELLAALQDARAFMDSCRWDDDSENTEDDPIGRLKVRTDAAIAKAIAA